MDNGGPAFPHEYKFSDGTANRDDGMSLRDWFAGMALQGLVNAGYRELTNGSVDPEGEVKYVSLESHIAGDCFKQADAMLEERKK